MLLLLRSLVSSTIDGTTVLSERTDFFEKSNFSWNLGNSSGSMKELGRTFHFSLICSFLLEGTTFALPLVNGLSRLTFKRVLLALLIIPTDCLSFFLFKRSTSLSNSFYLFLMLTVFDLEIMGLSCSIFEVIWRFRKLADAVFRLNRPLINRQSIFSILYSFEVNS